MPCRCLVLLLLLTAANVNATDVQITPQDSGVKVRLRGISAVTPDIAWASGREGTVLRTIDGGKHWQQVNVPDAKDLDFRDVEGFDANTAIVLSIGPGEASRIYRTTDAGKTWQLTLQNHDPRAFFDCMVFDGGNGWMLGDPVDGHFQIQTTTDAGKTWQLSPDGPNAQEGEAAFAASGTCIAKVGKRLIVATGGTVARLHYRDAEDGQWLATSASDSPAGEARGFFSVAPSNGMAFAVGGDYKAESAPGFAAWTTVGVVDYGKKTVIEGAESRQANEVSTPVYRLKLGSSSFIDLQSQPSPPGYRSGVSCMDDNLPCIAVGPSGIDRWDGDVWSAVSDMGLDAIDIVGNVGWASGDAGRVVRVEIMGSKGR